MKYLMANTHLNLYDLVWLSPPTYGSYFPWLFGHGNVLVTQSLLCGGWCCVVRGVLWDVVHFSPIQQFYVFVWLVTAYHAEMANFPGTIRIQINFHALCCFQCFKKFNLIEILKQATPIQFLACWLSDEKRYEWVSDLILIHAILFF